ncbi:MAG: hypothetical protein QF752_11130 [Planctomycetota bacterium]|nr:hypothetical protein [Planctomycetota bacterium]
MMLHRNAQLSIWIFAGLLVATFLKLSMHLLDSFLLCAQVLFGLALVGIGVRWVFQHFGWR